MKTDIIDARPGRSPRIAGTGLLVCCLQALARDGFSVERILDLYPQLTPEQLEAALAWPAVEAEEPEPDLHERLVAAWRKSGLKLGRLLVLACDRYAIAAHESLPGIVDAALVAMAERYVAEAATSKRQPPPEGVHIAHPTLLLDAAVFQLSLLETIALCLRF